MVLIYAPVSYTHLDVYKRQVAASLKVLDLVSSSGDLRERLHYNTLFFRERMTAEGFKIVPGEHPIVPVMLGDAVLASKMADALLERGIYVVGFSYPVVPQGKARIRVQLSAAHTREQLEFAVRQDVYKRQHEWTAGRPLRSAPRLPDSVAMTNRRRRPASAGRACRLTPAGVCGRA